MSNDGGLNKMRREWQQVKAAWKVEHADQSGWTHEVAQKVRTLTRKGPVIAAHIILTLAAYTLISLIAFGLWVHLTIKQLEVMR